MSKTVDFDVTQVAPTLDCYRREWVPKPGAGLAGMWIGAVVADSAGNDYWGLRGADDFLGGMTHVVTPICGFRALQKDLDGNPPHLFAEYSTIDWYEPLQYLESADGIQLTYPSGRIERNADGFHWYDCSGRWELHGKTVSDAVTVHVPKQDGVADEVYYRHELIEATGTIDGVEVSGFVHQDFAYGPPGKVYADLPIARQLQGMWVSWFHEYDDGELGGGCFWQGRSDLTFGPGYQFKGAVTTTHDDVVAKPTFDERGRVTALDVTMGADSYSFAFDSSGSPLHFFGPMTSSSSGKRPARSWCWIEYTGDMMSPEILDLMMQQFRLARGR